MGKLELGIFQKLPENLKHMYTKFPEGRVKFRNIELGTGITDGQDFIDTMQAQGIHIEYATQLLQNDDFKVVGEHRRADLVEVSVRDLGFNGTTRYDKIVERAKELGLEVCPAEVGPQLRLQYTDQPFGEYLIVAMNAISGRGGGPHVRIFDNFGELFDAGFFAYDESMREGVNVACGNLDGDARDELVTFPAAGGEPRVRVWEREDGAMTMTDEFLAFDADDRRGLVGTVSDGRLSVANQRGATIERKTYVIHSPATLVDEETLPTNDRGITSLFEHDRAITFATSQSAEIVSSSKLTIAVTSATGSAAAAAADFNDDDREELVVVESRPWFGEEGQEGKRIVVDLSEQRLYAYENGLLSNSFLVSTARPPYRTPVGEHSVLAKVPLVHYAGGSGADAYDLGWIPYNLRFYPHIYIHYAPWHNNFGYVISHGCVNVALENIKWVYDWAEVGNPVIVQE